MKLYLKISINKTAMKKIILVLALLFSLNAFSQDKEAFISLQFSDKSVSLYPFYKTFSVGLAPAITIAIDRELSYPLKSNLINSLELTWYNHKMIGAGLTFISNIGYKYQLNNGLHIEPKIGAGYNVFYPARELFVLNELGEYESKNILHFTFAGSVGLGIGYQVGRIAIYTQYSYMIERKYNGILPFLPTSLLGVGIKYQISSL